MENPVSPPPEPHCHVFMDESGDPGFKVEKGSSPDLSLAIVIFQSPESMNVTEQAIQDLKHEMGRRQTSEFHFNKESVGVRIRFCKGICQCPFTIRALTVDKSRIYPGSHLRQSSRHFYNFLTKMLLQHTFGSITDAVLCVDGSINRELKTYLRQQLNTEDKRMIRETKFKDSATTPLIQLADMVVGSIAKAGRTDDKRDDRYLRILLPRVEDIWEFGRGEE